jgi:AAA ATPase domain
LAACTELIGRDSELAQLRGLVDPPPAESRVLVLLGDAGMGKSVLMADAAQRATAAGLRAIQVTGRVSERNLAFAGLHQLLRSVLDRVADLPSRQANALLGAFGLADDPVPPGPPKKSTRPCWTSSANERRPPLRAGRNSMRATPDCVTPPR